MRKESLEEGEFYHIYNRGVDKRPIFIDDRSKIRFINSMYVLNNFLDIPNRFDIVKLEPLDLLTPIEPYVEIVAGCLMSNHYHLVLTPKRKGGISKFLHKVALSHTHYFNIRSERSGRLFESVFKAKHVDRGEYASYLTQYIHLNPVELYRTKIGTKDIFEHVESYPWSSLPIYLGKPKNSQFSLIVSDSFRNQILGMSDKEYRQLTEELYKDLYRS